MPTREQEFSDVRRLLDNPKEGKPSPDLIVAGLIRREQFMMNQQNGAARGWSSNTAQLTADVDTGEYSLYSNDPTNTLPLSGFGKALFVYRALDNNVIMPVPFTDYVNEFDSQSYELMLAPASAGIYPSVSGEKIAFFRSGSLPKARIYPPPTEARAYQIVYATGALDWDSFEWTDEPFLPEWSHFKCIAVALTLIDECEWTALTPGQNDAKQTRRAANLKAQFDEQEAEYQPYLRNPQHGPSISTVGAWWE